jgi:hypothetical protein
MKKTIVLLIVAVVAISLLAAGIAVYKDFLKNKDRNNTSAGEEVAVRDLVTRFGSVMKNVSLLAPDAASEIRTTYAPFVSEDILAFWEKNPTKAPGRLTSSPWPDRIEIQTIERAADGAYEVQAKIIEMTSSGPAGEEPLAMKIRNQNGRWIITGIELAVPKSQ